MSSIKCFFYWPGLYKLVSHLTANCLDCQKNKQKRKDEAPLEKWTETVPFPFHTVHIDHKGPIKPPSNGNKHCLVVIDSFSRYIQIYPVSSTSASKTISALEQFFLTFGIPQKLVYDKGSAFTLPGPTEKLRPKTNTLAHISESFLNKLIVNGVT